MQTATTHATRSASAPAEGATSAALVAEAETVRERPRHPVPADHPRDPVVMRDFASYAAAALLSSRELASEQQQFLRFMGSGSLKALQRRYPYLGTNEIAAVVLATSDAARGRLNQGLAEGATLSCDLVPFYQLLCDAMAKLVRFRHEAWPAPPARLLRAVRGRVTGDSSGADEIYPVGSTRYSTAIRCCARTWGTARRWTEGSSSRTLVVLTGPNGAGVRDAVPMAEFTFREKDAAVRTANPLAAAKAAVRGNAKRRADPSSSRGPAFDDGECAGAPDEYLLPPNVKLLVEAVIAAPAAVDFVHEACGPAAASVPTDVVHACLIPSTEPAGGALPATVELARLEAARAEAEAAANRASASLEAARRRADTLESELDAARAPQPAPAVCERATSPAEAPELPQGTDDRVGTPETSAEPVVGSPDAAGAGDAPGSTELTGSPRSKAPEAAFAATSHDTDERPSAADLLRPHARRPVRGLISSTPPLPLKGQLGRFVRDRQAPDALASLLLTKSKSAVISQLPRTFLTLRDLDRLVDCEGAGLTHYAALSGSAALLRAATALALQLGGRSRGPDGHGRSVLAYAAWSGSVECLRAAMELAGYRADMFAGGTAALALSDRIGVTVADYAAWSGSVAAASFAVQRLATNGGTAVDACLFLQGVAQGGNTDAFDAVFAVCASCGLAPSGELQEQLWQPVFFAALRTGNVALVDRVLPAAGASAGRALWRMSEEETRRNAAHVAAFSGSAPLIKAAQENGADFSDADIVGFEPVHFAALSGSVEALALAIGCGNSIDASANDGCTPLLAAAGAGQAAAVTWLLQSGADATVTDHDGATALHYAAYGGSVEVFMRLKRKLGVAAVRKQDRLGRLPLHLAARGGSLDVITSCFGGSLADVRDGAGHGLVAQALASGCIGIAEYLIERLEATPTDAEILASPAHVKAAFVPPS